MDPKNCFHDLLVYPAHQFSSIKPRSVSKDVTADGLSNRSAAISHRAAALLRGRGRREAERSDRAAGDHKTSTEPLVKEEGFPRKQGQADGREEKALRKCQVSCGSLAEGSVILINEESIL